MKNINDVPIIIRREVEARMIKPFLEEFAKEIGEKRTYEIAKDVIGNLALESGKDFAERLKNDTTQVIVESLKPYQSNGALNMDYKSIDDNHVRFDIIDCGYVEMYDKLGMKDLGSILSCHRDAMFFKGLNSHFELTRTQTIMDGCDHCDFRIDNKKESSPDF